MRMVHIVVAFVLLQVQLVLGDNGISHWIERKKMFDQHREERNRKISEHYAAEEAAPRSDFQFLTSKTEKYLVKNGSLPFIDFDIGESYAGLLPLKNNPDRSLFFWYFPSSTGAGSKDITLWLNGGPTCSSLIGLVEENGPFVWRPGTYGPKKNFFGFNKLTNMVWVEQPVGTGYSQGTPTVTGEEMLAEQFNDFWENFIDLFELNHYNVYLTGESYAGMYVPYIGDDMLNRSDTNHFNLKGIMIYDPVVGPGEYENPTAVPFALANAVSFPFEPKMWSQLLEAHEKCGFAKWMSEAYVFPPKGPLPSVPNLKNPNCALYNDIYYGAFTQNFCFNIYHTSETCPTPGDILVGGRGIAPTRESFFNRDDVKTALHVPTHVRWTECSSSYVGNFDHNTLLSGVQGGPIMRIAEATNNVVVGHAKRDMILLSNATLFTLNNLVWNGARGFEEAPTKPLWVPQNYIKPLPNFRYMGTWTESRGITFMEMVLSGHMVPQFIPGTAFRHLEYLLGRVSSLSDKVDWTVNLHGKKKKRSR